MKAWIELLNESGAAWEADAIASFGDPAGESRTAADAGGLCPFTHQGVLAVSGADADAFLQGQLTADVTQIAAGESALAAWCSSKGRVLALIRVLPLEGGYHLVLDGARTGEAERRLRMFVLRAAVEIENVSDQIARFGLCAPGDEAVRRTGLPVPERANRVASWDGLSVARLLGPGVRLDLSGPPARVREAWLRLRADFRPIGLDAWRAGEILAGSPFALRIAPDEFVPQMLNLERLGAVSFEKGCYVGQEIVARTQHLGRIKRRMFIAHLDREPTGKSPAAIIDAEAAESIGTLLCLARHPREGLVGLAVARLERADSSALHVDSATGPGVTLELPDYMASEAS